ncbi:MAG: PqqD family protein [bacterium]
MENLNKYPVKSIHTASRVVDGEAVVVMPMESAINTFNEVGTRIWELADGTNTVTDIIHEIQQEFEVDAETAELDTREFLNELVEKNMITLNDEAVKSKT